MLCCKTRVPDALEDKPGKNVKLCGQAHHASLR